jgi:ATP-binding cassette, subfamily C (CFTR/MRP), member 1
MMVVAAIAGRKSGARQKAWLSATDKRVKFLSSIINKFLPIKWSRYEDIMAARADNLRNDEMEKARTF